MAQTRSARRWPRRLAIILGIFVALCVLIFGAFSLYASDYYHDLDVDHSNLVSTKEMPVNAGADYLAFGSPQAKKALVFYPGAKIEYSAYAPLMREIAEHGYLCIVVDMPFNFAFFDIDAALRIKNDYPDVEHWWIGGHSLGGAMAASAAAGNAEQFEGLVLLGSYSADDLSSSDLSVISIYGSNDQVLNREKLEESRLLMPPRYTEEVIEGGNHADFGNYGSQDGDGAASITPEKQWRITAESVALAMGAS